MSSKNFRSRCKNGVIVRLDCNALLMIELVRWAVVPYLRRRATYRDGEKKENTTRTHTTRVASTLVLIYELVVLAIT